MYKGSEAHCHTLQHLADCVVQCMKYGERHKLLAQPFTVATDNKTGTNLAWYVISWCATQLNASGVLNERDHELLSFDELEATATECIWHWAQRMKKALTQEKLTPQTHRDN